MPPAPAAHPARTQQRRAFWLKHLHQWHWVSAAACLVGMILFSLTGFTLNHPTWISAKPEVQVVTAELPAEQRRCLVRSALWRAGAGRS